MKEVIEKYKKWKEGKDDGYTYDEIFNFVDGELSRGELLSIFEYLEKNI